MKYHDKVVYSLLLTINLISYCLHRNNGGEHIQLYFPRIQSHFHSFFIFIFFLLPSFFLPSFFPLYFFLLSSTFLLFVVAQLVSPPPSLDSSMNNIVDRLLSNFSIKKKIPTFFFGASRLISNRISNYFLVFDLKKVSHS